MNKAVAGVMKIAEGVPVLPPTKAVIGPIKLPPTYGRVMMPVGRADAEVRADVEVRADTEVISVGVSTSKVPAV